SAGRCSGSVAVRVQRAIFGTSQARPCPILDPEESGRTCRRLPLGQGRLPEARWHLPLLARPAQTSSYGDTGLRCCSPGSRVGPAASWHPLFALGAPSRTSEAIPPGVLAHRKEFPD